MTLPCFTEDSNIQDKCDKEKLKQMAEEFHSLRSEMALSLQKNSLLDVESKIKDLMKLNYH